MAEEIAKEYPEVKWDDWFIDITTAKLIDPARRSAFKVFVLPNLYGDIITDEAAQIQGGVGTAGSANIGTKYAMFEAIRLDNKGIGPARAYGSELFRPGGCEVQGLQRVPADENAERSRVLEHVGLRIG